MKSYSCQVCFHTKIQKAAAQPSKTPPCHGQLEKQAAPCPWPSPSRYQPGTANALLGLLAKKKGACLGSFFCSASSASLPNRYTSLLLPVFVPSTETSCYQQPGIKGMIELLSVWIQSFIHPLSPPYPLPTRRWAPIPAARPPESSSRPCPYPAPTFPVLDTGSPSP